MRQLENVCHWLTVMAPGQVVEVSDLPAELLQTERPAPRRLAARLAAEASAGLARGGR